MIVSQAAVNQELLNQGLEASTATEAEKSFARLAIIMRGTTAAQGDALRTADGFANSMRGLFASVKDTAAAIGGPLLEPLARVARTIAGSAEAVQAFAKANAGLIRIAAGVAAGIAGIGLALLVAGGGIIAAGAVLGGLATILTTLGAVASAVVSPLGLAVAAVAGIGTAIVRYTSAGAQAVEFLKDQFGTLLRPVLTAFTGIRDALAAGDVQLAAEVLMAGVRATVAVGVAKIKQVWGGIRSFFVGVWYDAVSGVTLGLSLLEEAFFRSIGFIKKAWANASAFVQSSWASAQNVITRAVLQSQKFITEKLTGEEFSIDVELNEADRKLNKTLSGIADATDRAVAEANRQTELQVGKIQTERQLALEAIDDKEQANQRAVNAEVAAAAQSAREARENLQALRDQAGEAAAVGGDLAEGGGIAEKFAGLIDQAAGGIASATAKIESQGTFSGLTAAAQLSPARDKSIDQRQQMIAELKAPD